MAMGAVTVIILTINNSGFLSKVLTTQSYPSTIERTQTE